MDQYIPLITGSGGALVVMAIICWLLASGKLHSDSEFIRLDAENDELQAENEQLRAALETERKTVNEAASAGQVNVKVIEAMMTAFAAGSNIQKAIPPAAGLTAEDLGL